MTTITAFIIVTNIIAVAAVNQRLCFQPTTQLGLSEFDEEEQNKRLY